MRCLPRLADRRTDWQDEKGANAKFLSSPSRRFRMHRMGAACPRSLRARSREARKEGSLDGGRRPGVREFPSGSTVRLSVAWADRVLCFHVVSLSLLPPRHRGYKPRSHMRACSMSARDPRERTMIRRDPATEGRRDLVYSRGGRPYILASGFSLIASY